MNARSLVLLTCLRGRSTVAMDEHPHETAFVASAANALSLLAIKREQAQSHDSNNLNVLRHMYYNRVALRCWKGA
jgi:hypothetical protein